ncbi:MAG: hypothetical protein HZB46_15850, partial [Solirubrobacterales bacterium]|nr:hypothetical protein [Solirubrobacterales bacterium]
MRGRLIITALLALSLHGCGSGDTTDEPGGASPAQVRNGSAVAAKPAASGKPADGAAGQAAPAKAKLPQQTSVAGG